ncbi:MAG: amino acid racemase [Rhodospirillales bacterium]|jgi:aspartate racemase|nr:amino acid racemase [Rhodospirillales bacterium]
MKGVLGVLGGMGPLATVDFMRKVIEVTPVTRDQDHLPMIVHSIPQVPDRTAAILGGGESPLPMLGDGIAALNRAGVNCIAMPCNTAHYWFDEIARGSKAPILHIVDAAAEALDRRGFRGATVGLLGTTGTVTSGIYQSRLETRGFACLVPEPGVQEDRVMAGIDQVKAGHLDDAKRLLEDAATGLRARDVATIVLGCTEIPVVLADDALYLDSTKALAETCVAWFVERGRLARAS